MNIQRGLQGKLDKLQIEINKYTPDIIILSEHGLKQENLETTYIPEYSLTTHFCRTTHMWGGIALYTKDNIDTKIEVLDTEKTEMTFKTIDIKINTKNKTL